MSNNPGYKQHGRDHEPQATKADLRRFRQEEAIARTEKREKRSDKEQLALLIERGHPNCREALRLANKIGEGR